MKKFKQSLVIVAGKVLFAGVVVLIAPNAGEAQKQPTSVKITNTPSEAVPVTGSVNVSNPVTVTGTVNLSNPPSEPVPVTGIVNIGNAVQTVPTIPTTAFSVVRRGEDGRALSWDLEGSRYAVTSFTATNKTTVELQFLLIANYWFTTPTAPPGTSCQGTGGIPSFIQGPFVVVPPGQTVHVAFPQPFLMKVPSGVNRSCLELMMPLVSSTSFFDPNVSASIVGYKY